MLASTSVRPTGQLRYDNNTNESRSVTAVKSTLSLASFRSCNTSAREYLHNEPAMHTASARHSSHNEEVHTNESG